MTLKVYGHRGAVCTKRVIITLAELNLPYELVHIDLLKGEQKQPAYLEKHPFGKIPYLEDVEGNETIGIAESRAICRYLVSRYSDSESKLMPKKGNFKEYARLEEAASFEEAYFDVHTKGAALEFHFARFRGREPDQNSIQEHLKELDAVLKTYDQILSGRAYIAGDDFTIVDIFHGPCGDLVQRGAGGKEYFEKYPNVQRWWKDITGRDSFRVLDVGFS